MVKKNSPFILNHLKLEIIDKLENVYKLKEKWDKLFFSCDNASVYQSFSWNFTLLKSRYKNLDIAIITVSEEEDLIGIAPFIVYSRLKTKIIELVGHDEYSYPSILIKENRQDAIEAIGLEINNIFKNGILHISYFEAGSRESDVLMTSLMTFGWKEIRWQRNISHCIKGEKDFESYFKKKSKKSRANIKREIAKLEEDKDIEIVKISDGEITNYLIKRIAAIQNNSWLIKRGIEKIDSQKYQEIIFGLAQGKMAEVYLMSKGGVDVAYILNYCGNNRRYCISIGFDEKYEIFSPGKALMFNCLKNSFNNKVNHFDFLFGDAEYKKFWGNQTKIIMSSICYKGYKGWISSWYPYRMQKMLSRNRILKNIAFTGLKYFKRKKGYASVNT